MNTEILSTEASDPARILIAEDHPLFREALGQILSREANFEVVGEAADGVDALELCRRLQPELVLMDLGMPKMDGLQATQAIKSEFPHTIVLVLTASVDMGSLSDALRAGASGYILKDASSQQIIEAIRRVLRGEASLNQDLAMQLLLRQMDEGEGEKEEAEESNLISSTQKPSEAPLIELLSPREIEVLRLIVEGQTNKQIAQTLFISLSSVKRHVQRIVSKLGVSDRIQAAVKATELGLLPTKSESDTPTSTPPSSSEI